MKTKDIKRAKEAIEKCSKFLTSKEADKFTEAEILPLQELYNAVNFFDYNLNNILDRIGKQFD